MLSLLSSQPLGSEFSAQKADIPPHIAVIHRAARFVCLLLIKCCWVCSPVKYSWLYEISKGPSPSNIGLFLVKDPKDMYCMISYLQTCSGEHTCKMKHSFLSSYLLAVLSFQASSATKKSFSFLFFGPL